MQRPRTAERHPNFDMLIVDRTEEMERNSFIAPDRSHLPTFIP
jgi:hypothetical protein